MNRNIPKNEINRINNNTIVNNNRNNIKKTSFLETKIDENEMKFLNPNDLLENIELIETRIQKKKTSDVQYIVK